MALRLGGGAKARTALLTAIAALAIAAGSGRVKRYAVAEGSMRPALQPGDYVVAVASTKIERGAIIVYPDPAEPTRDLIKRVVGLGGETLTIAGGQVAVDGAVLAEPWADGPTFPDGTWQIPSEAIFTIGDNRRLSSGDSRASGPVRVDGIFRVAWRYWPFSGIGRL